MDPLGNLQTLNLFPHKKVHLLIENPNISFFLSWCQDHTFLSKFHPPTCSIVLSAKIKSCCLYNCDLLLLIDICVNTCNSKRFLTMKSNKLNEHANTKLTCWASIEIAVLALCWTSRTKYCSNVRWIFTIPTPGLNSISTCYIATPH